MASLDKSGIKLAKNTEPLGYSRKPTMDSAFDGSIGRIEGLASIADAIIIAASLFSLK